MWKNWKEICHVSDPNFRLFIALCTEQEMLMKMAFVFPELFRAKKPDQPGPFPLSYLRRVADEQCKDNEVGEVISEMRKIMSEIGMISFWYGAPEKDAISVDIPLTLEHRASFSNLINAARGKFFPWQLNRITINGSDFFTGAWTGDAADDVDVDIYPAALVDVNA